MGEGTDVGGTGEGGVSVCGRAGGERCYVYMQQGHLHLIDGSIK